MGLNRDNVQVSGSNDGSRYWVTITPADGSFSSSTDDVNDWCERLTGLLSSSVVSVMNDENRRVVIGAQPNMKRDAFTSKLLPEIEKAFNVTKTEL